jgi:uncharacterized membrane protein
MWPFSARSFGVPQDDKGHRRLNRAVLLAFILIAAAALRIHGLTRHSLWSDEIYTLESSAGFGLESKRLSLAGLVEDAPDLLSITPQRPWWTVATNLARDDNHPPLYFLLVRAWRDVAGDSDAALRSLSVLFSLGAIILLYDAVRVLHGPAAGLWTAAMMCVAAPQIQFAQEGRQYALMFLLGSGAYAALVRLECLGISRRRLAALGACSLALLLTHYYTVAPLCAMGAYAAIRFRGPVRRATLVVLLAAGVCFAAFWGWAMWKQRVNIAGNNWYIVEPPEGHLSQTLWRLLLVPMRCLYEPRRSAEPLAVCAGAVLYVLPLLLLRGRPRLLLWMLWLWAAVGMVLVIDLAHCSKQMLFLRYTVLASPAVYALVAALADGLRPRSVAPLLPALAVLASLVALPDTYAETPVPKPDWRPLAAAIDRDGRAGDVLLVYGDYPRDPGILPNDYLMLRHYAQRAPRTVIFTASPLTPPMLQRIGRADGVWAMWTQESDFSAEVLPGFTPGRMQFVFGLPRLQRWTPAPPATTSPRP